MNFFKECRVKPGSRVDLSKIDPGETFGWDKDSAKKQTEINLQRIAELQEVLYAEQKRGLILVLQAMDTGGKDGTIRVVGGAMNPAGVDVASFKKPTPEELAHHYLWRIEKEVPKKGEVVIFNRSHYEDVGVVRVHNLISEEECKKRYVEINEFEEKLAQPSAEIPEGTHMLKFWLHISKDEQWERFRDRIEDPTKHWKFSENDLVERQYWDSYMKTFGNAIANCSTGKAPWFIIPADNKWMRDLIVSQITVDYMEGLNMKFPPPSANIEAVRKKYFSGAKPKDNVYKGKPPTGPR